MAKGEFSDIIHPKIKSLRKYPRHAVKDTQQSFAQICGLEAGIQGRAQQLGRDVDDRNDVAPPLTFQFGSITHVTFSPDGRYLASASADATIVLWNVDTLQPAAPPLIGHSGAVNNLSFNPPGTLLASGGADATIILWNLDTFQADGPPLGGYTSPVNSVAFQPNSNSLAAGYDDGVVVLWDLVARPPTSRVLMRPAASVNSVALVFKDLVTDNVAVRDLIGAGPDAH